VGKCKVLVNLPSEPDGFVLGHCPALRALKGPQRLYLKAENVEASRSFVSGWWPVCTMQQAAVQYSVVFVPLKRCAAIPCTWVCGALAMAVQLAVCFLYRTTQHVNAYDHSVKGLTKRLKGYIHNRPELRQLMCSLTVS
jgi:hypothetical protein